MNAEEIIWKQLKAAGLNDYGVAGLMGNLYAESTLSPTNLQNTYSKKLDMTDEEYTAAVDSGKYQNFVRDSAGYGLAQWTFWSRKQGLLNYTKAAGKSIGDLEAQLGFLIQELSGGYAYVLNILKTASNVQEASNAVLLNFERPADQSENVQKKRAAYGQSFYDQYAGKAGGGETMSNSPLSTYTKISPNRNSPRNHVIDRVTIHCYVGQVTAKQGCDYLAKANVSASSNYVVGKDGSIGTSVDEADRSWCSSSRENDNRSVTIEVASDKTAPYAVTEPAYAALLDLVTDICRRNGKTSLLWFGDKSKTLSYVPKPNEMVMTVHRWFANKSCPGEYLYSRHGEIADEVNRRLNGESEMEDDDMNVERFTELWQEMRKGLQDNDAGNYSKEARAWAQSTGLIEGNGITSDGQPNCMWQDMLTREQFVTVLYRFAKLIGKA